MNVFVLIVDLILIILSITHLLIFISIYLRSYDKRHLYYILINFSLLLISLILITNYIVSSGLKAFSNNEVYIKLYFSYLLITLLTAVYFLIRYFLAIFNITLKKVSDFLILITVFLPLLIIEFMISINSDLNKLIIIENTALIEFSFIFLLFSVLSLSKIKIIDKDYSIFVRLLIISGLLFSATGFIDGFYKYFNWLYKFYFQGFNLLFFIIITYTLISLIIGLKTFIKLSKINLNNYSTDINSQIIKKYNISEREIEVIKQLVSGKTNKEISDTLFISLSTVRTHIYNVFLKTNVKNRVEIINLFFKSF
jgi:DNA-binding CsgD family transcriptional regulator